ncbi:hypothetical protein KVR01_011971 [Diaporthe batatas]|uniref:uncharacterized protein n=1 Tax=Diaporthe batatas TaxID=748121 RepID=UPI001D05A7E3|nr:uncharacterized protein KVR01_011971 [Diaporthe batatas]KAG8158210.1 hypothetical protein KVR01_011971 [Diaporthe batatas]
MDPLTALGLASNVFSFVSFAAGLIKGTVEISASATGCSIDVTRLDVVCEKLQDLCDGLESCTEYKIPGTDAEEQVSKVFVAVKSLCATCRTDGHELLRITRTLRTKNGSRGKWDSFKVALKKAWEKSSIDELEERLSRTQVTMTLHICTLAHHCSRAQSERVEYLQQQSLLLQADQGRSLERISQGLKDLEHRVRLGLQAGYSQHPQDGFTLSDVNCLQEKLQSLSISEQNVQRQQAILESLTFESRPVRHSQIAPAHKKTFKWALTTNQDPTLGHSIGSWLKQGDGIFWVSGKPGSGKSTLMKYIADSSVTSQFIAEWARPCRAAVASHYFWITGTPMQKSQQGLLQTLLFDIFRQRPDLIEQTCWDRWNGPATVAPWSLAELHGALQTFVTMDHANLKLCFFIDGLDEYSGDHEDRTQLCRTLKGLTTSGNIKLCLSSRPWNIFEEEFGLECPKIYMQDLTRDDIENYTSSRLEEHTRWAAVSANHSQGQWLVSEIAAKSNGVFLWVFLVTKLLREGMTNRDTFADLRRRLESFPSELEPFFKAMLEAVEPFYHSHMSTALQIANASTESQFSFLVYNFHFQEYEDSDYAINHPIRLMNADEIEEIRSNTSWQLDSRTRGLLEVNSQDGTVAFLHRTARDFLNTQEMYDFLITKADPRLNFRPILSILKALIATIKTSEVPHTIKRKRFANFEPVKTDNIAFHSVLKLMGSAMRYASEIESHMAGDIRHHALMDELDRSLLCMFSMKDTKFVPGYWSKMKQAFLREQLVQQGHFDYLRSKLDSDPTFLKNIGTLPVLRFFSPDPTKNIQLERGRGTDVLACLLDNHGMDPNKEDDCQGISPWNELLAHMCHWWLKEKKYAMRILSFLLEVEILKLFLKAGADPGALIVGPSPASGTYKSRAAAVVYLEFCFDMLDQSPPTQTLYLDVLSEFLRLSSDVVLGNVTDEFCAVLINKEKEELHWKLPFFAKVNDLLRLSLASRGSGTAENLLSLDRMSRQIFPLDLYTPMSVATKPRKRKRKHNESSSGRHQKHKREA